MKRSSSYPADHHQNIDIIEYWNDRGTQIQKFGNEYFYTTTEIPFYIYRRERILKILDEFDFNGKKILDYGCGDGFYSAYLHKKGASVVGLDISQKMIDFAKYNYQKDNNGISFFLTDGTNLKFESDYFDYIISSLVLQHVVDEKILSNLFNEFSRTLKENGELMHFDGVKSPSQDGGTILLRDKSDYINTSEDNGFKLVDNIILSTPFYNLAMKPYFLLKLILRKIGMNPRNHNVVERSFSKIAVSLTRIFDRWWQNDNFGCGYFRYAKK